MIHDAIRKIHPEVYLIEPKNAQLTGNSLDNIVCKDEEGNILNIDFESSELLAEIDRLEKACIEPNQLIS